MDRRLADQPLGRRLQRAVDFCELSSACLGGQLSLALQGGFACLFGEASHLEHQRYLISEGADELSSCRRQSLSGGRVEAEVSNARRTTKNWREHGGGEAAIEQVVACVGRKIRTVRQAPQHAIGRVERGPCPGHRGLVERVEAARQSVLELSVDDLKAVPKAALFGEVDAERAADATDGVRRAPNGFIQAHVKIASFRESGDRFSKHCVRVGELGRSRERGRRLLLRERSVAEHELCAFFGGAQGLLRLSALALAPGKLAHLESQRELLTERGAERDVARVEWRVPRAVDDEFSDRPAAHHDGHVELAVPSHGEGERLDLRVSLAPAMLDQRRLGTVMQVDAQVREGRRESTRESANHVVVRRVDGRELGRSEHTPLVKKVAQVDGLSGVLAERAAPGAEDRGDDVQHCGDEVLRARESTQYVDGSLKGSGRALRSIVLGGQMRSCRKNEASQPRFLSTMRPNDEPEPNRPSPPNGGAQRTPKTRWDRASDVVFC